MDSHPMFMIYPISNEQASPLLNNCEKSLEWHLAFSLSFSLDIYIQN